MRTGPGGAVSPAGGWDNAWSWGFGGSFETLRLSVKPWGFEDTQGVERGRQWGGGLLGVHGGKRVVRRCLGALTGR